MKKNGKYVYCFVIIALLFVITSETSPSYSQNIINPEEAQEHVGENQTVCGTVASTNYAIGSKGQPTFLNLNRPYPDHIFTIVIWGSDRHKFNNPPEEYFDTKKICVTGTITTYRGKPQIVVNSPSQINEL